MIKEQKEGKLNNKMSTKPKKKRNRKIILQIEKFSSIRIEK